MGERITVHLANNGVSTGQVLITDTRSLADAQGDALDRLSAQSDAVIAAGRIVTVQGTPRPYQIDDVARSNVAGAAILAMQGSIPDGFFWIALDNSPQVMTAADVTAFAKDIAIYWGALVVTNRALKDAIATLPTIAACDAFDATQGWPSNP